MTCRASTTRAVDKLLDQAAAIWGSAPTPEETAYMARQLVQATLPHSDPGDVPLWTRRNGNLTLGIQPGVDFKTGKSYGIPYGSIPRLLVCFITTEATTNKTRRIELGHNMAQFMREIGLDPYTGGGKRSDAARLKEQMTRFFHARLSFLYEQQTATQGVSDQRDMLVAERHVDWWDKSNPHQGALWDSFIELTEPFFQAIIAAPVPLDLRALKALKRSPLALDLYVWLSYEAHRVQRTGKSRFVAWPLLMQQLGTDYTGDKAKTNFQQKVAAALRKIKVVYPALKTGRRVGGIEVLPDSLPAIQPQLALTGKAEPV
jgi:hypothetical protein